ncbi:hypothetical protein LX97_03487 [Nonlabens dokdonensis]|jgi:hypothetical protein|nr:hypothetical protein [Nonlabens dokdonensis]PZX36196.1 hypothetical protein LX97_03487 [Nonlabens dokdonensis]
MSTTKEKPSYEELEKKVKLLSQINLKISMYLTRLLQQAIDISQRDEVKDLLPFTVEIKVDPEIENLYGTFIQKTE